MLPLAMAKNWRIIIHSSKNLNSVALLPQTADFLLHFMIIRLLIF